MHYRTLIKNATIVNEEHQFLGSVMIDNDRIEYILEGADAEGPIPADVEIDASGCYLMPGVIDTHVHFREPGLTHKADMDSESRAAAAGGVTTVLDMPNVVPQTTDRKVYAERLAIAQKNMHVNYGFYMGATADNGHELRHMNHASVCGIKLFMGSSTGNMLVDDEENVRRIFEQAKEPVIVHCEDDILIKRNMKRMKEHYGDSPIPVTEHPSIRTTEACVRSTKKCLELAEGTGVRLHVAHISTAEELELFKPIQSEADLKRQSHEEPVITAEACIGHLIFCDEDYARLGTRIKVNPAIKTRADRDALRKALTDGRIYTIGTDHAPHLLREKQGGALAASGMPMVQFSLLAMLSLVDEGVLSIERLVRLMCHNPANLFHIENRGYLREGYKADITIVRPHSPWTLTTNKIISKCNWSPLEGRVFNWRIDQTYVNGRLLFNRGHIMDERSRGQLITYQPR